MPSSSSIDYGNLKKMYGRIRETYASGDTAFEDYDGDLIFVLNGNRKVENKAAELSAEEVVRRRNPMPSVPEDLKLERVT